MPARLQESNRFWIALAALLLAAAASAPAEDQSALDFARRVREGGPLTKEELAWVTKFRREKQLTDEQLAVQIERCWHLSETFERSPSLRPSRPHSSRTSGTSATTASAAPLSYAWQTLVLISLASGVLLLAAIFLVQWLRARHQWLRHLHDLQTGASVSEMVIGDAPPAESEIDDTPPERNAAPRDPAE